MLRFVSATEQMKRTDVVMLLSLGAAWTRNSADPSKQRIVTLMRDWKEKEITATEKVNEAKDNVKYLGTLERFLDPLYSGTVETIGDAIPALMNSIKMILAIARYYSAREHMTNLFFLVVGQVIHKCKIHVAGLDLEHAKEFDPDKLWEMDTSILVSRLETSLRLCRSFQEQYDKCKAKLAESPKGRQFDFDEKKIFSRLDAFCRRLAKLCDLFTTVQQFELLRQERFEGKLPKCATTSRVLRFFFSFSFFKEKDGA